MTTCRSDGIARLLLKSSRYRAKRGGLRHTLTLADIYVPDRCPVLGLRLIPSKGRAGPNSPSLDRIDSRKGYVPGNVIVVSWRANELKKNATLLEMERVAAFYRQLADRK
ncbi:MULTISPECIES: hypothetical protein [Cupriavidus]|uniref:Uncharacterized protein n=1 Tax=Cupriavidus nantongensis TaxID=1796606 RepID=A0A142JMX5_9BURK|nr:MULTISPECIES: hypothetical protein [Cupriavidus]AMR79437.1 hypothetical protein A2G96_17765 [Cupriavidus nantongensis]SPA50593.1 conserved protein of unknown function [Cupriavidus taiwanensis]